MDWAKRLEQASRERVASDMPLTGILEVYYEFKCSPLLLIEGNTRTLQAVRDIKTHPWLSEINGKLELDPLEILLSQELSRQIIAWILIFDTAFDEHICRREDIVNFMDTKAFNKEGLMLFEKICQELLHFQIIYKPLDPNYYTKF